MTVCNRRDVALAIFRGASQYERSVCVYVGVNQHLGLGVVVVVVWVWLARRWVRQVRSLLSCVAIKQFCRFG